MLRSAPNEPRFARHDSIHLSLTGRAPSLGRSPADVAVFDCLYLRGRDLGHEVLSDLFKGLVAKHEASGYRTGAVQPLPQGNAAAGQAGRDGRRNEGPRRLRHLTTWRRRGSRSAPRRRLPLWRHTATIASGSDLARAAGWWRR
jgi:hypothetical protein